MKGNPSLLKRLCWETGVSLGVALLVWWLDQLVGKPMGYMGAAPRCLP